MMLSTSDYPRHGQRRDDPTQEEIRERCQKIREDWSETTRRQRSGQIRKSWTVPEARVLTSNQSSLVDG